MAKNLFTMMWAAALLFAADPWKSKKPADWTTDDASRVLARSPWAKTVSADIDFSRMGGGPGRGGPGMGQGGGMGGPGVGGPPGGGMGGPPGGMGGPMEGPKMLVRWESAAAVREACVRTESQHQAKIGGLSERYYIISVSGAMRGRPRGDAGGARPEPDYSRLRDSMLQATSLTVRGKESLLAAKLEMVETDAGLVTLFLFPRSVEIGAADKEAVFETAMGPMLVKAKFTFKDMLLDGRLSL